MARGRSLEVEQELIEAFKRSGRVNEYLASVLPARLWRTAPPGGRGRTIAAMFAHIQGVRRTFARMAGARPPKLDRESVTPAEAARAFQRSTDDLAKLFEATLAERRTRVKGMPRRVIDMMTYMIQHDAHHRGQICMLARDLGHEFKGEDSMRIWGWKALPPRRGQTG